MEGIGKLSPPRTREKLAAHAQAIQDEARKGVKADRSRIENAFRLIKCGADFLDESIKIIALCNKAYSAVATWLDLPPLGCHEQRRPQSLCQSEG